MDDEKVYEVERQTDEGWKPLGSMTVYGWAIRSTFLENADLMDWPDGTYRLLCWSDDFASGSYYSITLTSETVRKAEMPPAVGAEVEAS